MVILVPKIFSESCE